MIFQNISAVLCLFLVFYFSSVVYGSKRTYKSKLSSGNGNTDKKLDDNFNVKMKEFFTAEGIATMMRIIAKNNEHRMANGYAPTRFFFDSDALFQPVAQKDKYNQKKNNNNNNDDKLSFESIAHLFHRFG
jgi:hypothetical protein